MTVHPLDYLALCLMVGAYYLFMKTGIDMMTYKKPLRLVLLVMSVANTALFLFVSVPLSVAVLVIFLAALRMGWKEILVVTLITEMGFFLSVFIITAALAVLGTALHIPGYEMHGSLQELIRRAMGGSRGV